MFMSSSAEVQVLYDTIYTSSDLLLFMYTANLCQSPGLSILFPICSSPCQWVPRRWSQVSYWQSPSRYNVHSTTLYVHLKVVISIWVKLKIVFLRIIGKWSQLNREVVCVCKWPGLTFCPYRLPALFERARVKVDSTSCACAVCSGTWLWCCMFLCGYHGIAPPTGAVCITITGNTQVCNVQ